MSKNCFQLYFQQNKKKKNHCPIIVATVSIYEIYTNIMTIADCFIELDIRNKIT